MYQLKWRNIENEVSKLVAISQAIVSVIGVLNIVLKAIVSVNYRNNCLWLLVLDFRTIFRTPITETIACEPYGASLEHDMSSFHSPMATKLLRNYHKSGLDTIVSGNNPSSVLRLWSLNPGQFVLRPLMTNCPAFEQRPMATSINSNSLNHVY